MSGTNCCRIICTIVFIWACDQTCFHNESCGLAQSSPETSTSDESETDFPSYLPLITDDTLSLSYFLDELNIVGYQQEQLKKLTKKTRTEWFKMFVQLTKDKASLKKDPDRAREFAALQERFVEGLSDVLLPNQMDGIRKLLKQRTHLKKLGIESFLLPAMVADELELKPEEKNNLRKEIRALYDDYERKKKELVKSSLKETASVLPSDAIIGIDDLISLVGNAPQSKSQRCEITELKDWTDDDYKDFEEREFVRWVLLCNGYDPLKTWLEIFDQQATQMHDIVNQVIAERDEDWRVDPNYARLINLAPEGQLEELKSEIKKKQDAELERQQKIADKVASEVLLPHQAEALRRIAKFRRVALEAKYGDDFATIVSWAKVFGDSEMDESKSEKLFDSARTRYYKDLEALKEELTQKSMEALPETAKAIFTSLYGEMYDYQAEQIHRWNEFRMSSK